MNGAPVVLVPRGLAQVLCDEAPWGWLTAAEDSVEGVILVTGYSVKDATPRRVSFDVTGAHYTSRCDPPSANMIWYRCQQDLNEYGRAAAGVGAAIPSQHIKDGVQGWREPPPNGAILAITVAVKDERPDLVCWLLSQHGAVPLGVPAFFPEEDDLRQLLEPGWPVGVIDRTRFVLIGTGSIGSIACESLLRYGAREITIVDPDRLFARNTVRFPATRAAIGRFKVNFLKEQLEQRFPYADIRPLVLDVVDDANRLRPILQESDIVVCCADGVEARQATNHLARWARRPLVLACVLDNGGVGEIIRLRPTRTAGCLRCQRAAMSDAGEMDPEPELDAGYATGNRHAPMTAVGGDLALIGQWAAKIAVSTVLEAAGFRDQRLPGDHAIIGLRPAPDLAAPFDLPAAGVVRWRPSAIPIDSCSTCGGEM